MTLQPPTNRPDARAGFVALQAGGLDWESLPLRLFRKGNARAWNPADLDFATDRADWQQLPPVAQEAFARLCAMFLGGEEAVTHDIQPFMAAMSAEGRLGDEMYLTQFCFEESRHIQVFRLWLDAVGLTGDLNGLLDDNDGYRAIFCEALPAAMDALRTDPSPANQVRASVTYNHVVEGTLALTGYFAWDRVCRSMGIFPGMRRIIALIGDDERRHMAWGTHTCRRHVAADPSIWPVARSTMRSLMPHAVRQIREATGGYPPELFSLDTTELVHYAVSRATRRLGAIRSAATEGELDGSIGADAVSEDVESDLAREDAAAELGVAPALA